MQGPETEVLPLEVTKGLSHYSHFHYCRSHFTLHPCVYLFSGLLGDYEKLALGALGAEWSSETQGLLSKPLDSAPSLQQPGKTQSSAPKVLSAQCSHLPCGEHVIVLP